MSGARLVMVITTLAAFAALVTGATAAEQAATAGSYKLVGKWGKAGTGNGQFGSNAYGLATDGSGRVYVADTDNRRIQIFSGTGAFQGKISFGETVVPEPYLTNTTEGEILKCRNCGGIAKDLKTRVRTG